MPLKTHESFLSSFDQPTRFKPIGTRNEPLSTQSEAILDFVQRRLRFMPDPVQQRILLSNSPRMLLNCTRQWGKSTVCAAKAIHRAYTTPGALILVATPGERQSAEFLRKAAAMLGNLGIRPRGDGDNAISLLFPNGARIVGLPGTEATVRGFSSVSLILIDEAACVSESMYKSLRPMLAVSDGDLWLMSTPRGKRGFFYHAWEHESDDWERIRVPATECPRISARFLEREPSKVGLPWFRQEFMCEFLDNGLTVFGRDLVEGALDDSISPLDIDTLGTIWE